MVYLIPWYYWFCIIAGNDEEILLMFWFWIIIFMVIYLYTYIIDLWLLSYLKLLNAIAAMDSDEECSIVLELSENDPFFDEKKVNIR